MEESIRMTEDRYKGESTSMEWPTLGSRTADEECMWTVCMYTLVSRSKQYIQAQQTAVNTVHQTYNSDQVR